LRIVCDQIGAPTLNTEIAAATTKILAQISGSHGGPLSIAEVTGIYHLTAGGAASWYDFATAILEEAAASPAPGPWFAAATGGLPLVARRAIPIPTIEYFTPARRPAYSVLSNSRLSRTFSLQLPDWRRQLHSIFANPPAKTS